MRVSSYNLVLISVILVLSRNVFFIPGQDGEGHGRCHGLGFSGGNKSHRHHGAHSQRRGPQNTREMQSSTHGKELCRHGHYRNGKNCSGVKLLEKIHAKNNFVAEEIFPIFHIWLAIGLVAKILVKAADLYSGQNEISCQAATSCRYSAADSEHPCHLPSCHSMKMKFIVKATDLFSRQCEISVRLRQAVDMLQLTTSSPANYQLSLHATEIYSEGCNLYGSQCERSLLGCDKLWIFCR